LKDILGVFHFLRGTIMDTPTSQQFQTNLFAELSKVERHHMVVPMPFRNKHGVIVEFPMVSLNGRENYEVKQKADADTRASYGKDIPKKDEVSDYEERRKDNLMAWTVVYSIRLPHDLNVRFFPDKNALFDCNITPDQIAIIFDDYMTVQYNQPWLTHLDNDDPEKTEALIAQIIKDGKDPHFFLNSLTSLSHNILHNSMGAKLAKLQKDSGSPITPLEDGMTSK
jgi:hypothetical protein